MIINPVSQKLTPISKMQRRGQKTKSNHAMVIKSSEILSITGPCRSSCKVNENHPKPHQTRRQVPRAKCQRRKSSERRSGLLPLSMGIPPHPSRSHWPKRTWLPTPPRRQLRNLGCQVRKSGIFGRCTGMSYLRQGRLGHQSSFLVGGARSLRNSVSKFLLKGQ